MQIFNTYIIELAVFSALLSLFLDFCFKEGNIFEGWLDFLADLHLPISVKEALDNDREERFKMVDWFWFKPLGGCVVCMNVWISFITCILFYKKVQVDLCLPHFTEFLAGTLLMVLLSNILVRLINKVFD